MVVIFLLAAYNHVETDRLLKFLSQKRVCIKEIKLKVVKLIRFSSFTFCDVVLKTPAVTVNCILFSVSVNSISVMFVLIL